MAQAIAAPQRNAVMENAATDLNAEGALGPDVDLQSEQFARSPNDRYKRQYSTIEDPDFSIDVLYRTTTVWH